MPTILGLCNINIPASIEGDDLSKYISGKEILQDNPVLIVSITPFGPFNRDKGGIEYRGIRTKQYTYVCSLNGPWMLFDNKADPYQLKNLVGKTEFAVLQARLEEVLKQKLKKIHDEFLPGDTYIKKWNYVVDETGTIPFKW